MINDLEVGMMAKVQVRLLTELLTEVKELRAELTRTNALLEDSLDNKEGSDGEAKSP